MQLAVLCSIVAACLAGACNSHSARAPAAVPPPLPATPRHDAVAPAPPAVPSAAPTAPPPVASGVVAQPVKRAVQTCAEPCQGCTILTESDGPLRSSRSPSKAEKALLKDVFISYLLSADCQADPEHVDVRQLGKSQRDISGVQALVDGSFTRAGRKQTLVSFFMGHCGVLGPSYEQYGLRVIVIMDAGKIVMVTHSGPTTAIDFIAVDIENDGMDELLALSAYAGSARTATVADLWSVADGMTPLADFDLSLRSCLGDEPEYFESQLVTHRDPQTGQLCFLQRRSEQQCPPP